MISGVVPFGFFVRLDHLLAEGLVRVSSIYDDYYIFDERRQRWVGRTTKRIYKLGERVKVQVVRVDRDRREIDFTLAGMGYDKEKGRRKKEKGRKRGKSRR